MTKHTISLPAGNEIAYWAHHSDKKPTVVFVHGFTGSHDGFQYLVPELTDFRLIIPDLPGFGSSPLPHESVTLAHLGEMLAQFVDALKLQDPPHLLGHSMGSLVVAEAVRQKPDSFAKKLILISPVPSPIGMADFRRLGALLSQLYYVASHRLPVVGKHLSTSKKLTRLSTNLIMTAKDKKVRAAIYEHHFDNLRYISSIGWYSKMYRQINKTGISRYRHALAPFDVLILTGDKDSVTPLKHQKKSARQLGAKLDVIRGVGHLSHYETPKQLATKIRGFLR